MSISFIKIETDDTISSASKGAGNRENSTANDSPSSTTSVDSGTGEDNQYKIYNDSDIMKFFSENPAETVSETCLVNDHFILVKMSTPTITCWKCKTRDIEDEELHNETSIKRPPETGARRKLRNFFNCKRCRRIAPQPSSAVEQNVAKLEQMRDSKRQVIWSSSIEADDALSREIVVDAYNSCSRSSTPNEEPESEAVPQEAINVEGETTEPISAHHMENSKTAKDFLKQSKSDNLQLSTDSPLKLECYTNIQETETTDEVPELITNKTPSVATASSWRRLLNSLGMSSGKQMLAKRKAMICKTYFIRWTKPPETLWHGYGVDPSSKQSHAITPVRRCRSSIF